MLFRSELNLSDGLVLVGLTLYTNVTCANINLLLPLNHHLIAHDYVTITFSLSTQAFIHFSYSVSIKRGGIAVLRSSTSILAGSQHLLLSPHSVVSATS